MFEIVVIGAGHAGCEAALACARMGCETLLFTLNLDAVALMACNPAIGGTGKGHLVREVDALGGEMGLAIDDTTLQSRMLNSAKGPAVYSLRAQADKRQYQERMKQALFTQPHLTVRQGEVKEILTNNGIVTGVRTITGDTVPCRACVVATGVYLKSRVIIGEAQWNAGPQGLLPATGLSESLAGLGFSLRRFKTGTPARIDARSIDFDRMEPQEGDEPPVPFSFMTDRRIENRMRCFLTWTNAQTHAIIRENLDRAPMFNGAISGLGPRYCPSIESKIVRFADKEKHQLFLEPEGYHHPEWYAQGMSTSLPEDVQWRMYRSIRGLERAVLTRLAYAIEYDCIDSTQLSPALSALHVPGLYFAGQINGTSGYEEAAAQGILAGINAARYIRKEDAVILTRDMAYIGVMTDDLTTKGTDEPYRMMTSRAEHRLYLRQDNADLRLTAIGRAVGLVGDDRMRRMEEKAKESAELRAFVRDNGLEASLRKPETRINDLLDGEKWSLAAREQVEIGVKYEGYLKKQDAQIRQAQAMEEQALPPDAPYLTMNALRTEARQKLEKQRPRSLGQASRIPGVSPADIAVLMVWLRHRSRAGAEVSG